MKAFHDRFWQFHFPTSGILDNLHRKGQALACPDVSRFALQTYDEPQSKASPRPGAPYPLGRRRIPCPIRVDLLPALFCDATSLFAVQVQGVPSPRCGLPGSSLDDVLSPPSLSIARSDVQRRRTSCPKKSPRPAPDDIFGRPLFLASCPTGKCLRWCPYTDQSRLHGASCQHGIQFGWGDIPRDRTSSPRGGRTIIHTGNPTRTPAKRHGGCCRGNGRPEAGPTGLGGAPTSPRGTRSGDAPPEMASGPPSGWTWWPLERFSHVTSPCGQTPPFCANKHEEKHEE